MVSLQVFLIGLSAVSVLTGIVTEAVKHVLNSLNRTYQSNILSGIVAAILAAAIGVGYVIIAGVGFTAANIVCIVALAFMGWLSAMVGYDKVVQVINQFKNVKKG